jgi:hypothetical protein
MDYLPLIIYFIFNLIEPISIAIRVACSHCRKPDYKDGEGLTRLINLQYRKPLKCTQMILKFWHIIIIK